MRLMDFSLEDQYSGFLSTPQIFAAKVFGSYPLLETSPWLQGEKPTDIPASSERVLGKRMEHFFAYYISNSPSNVILAHSLQIIQDKTTIGELDFLIKDITSEEVSHVELVFKFYLFDPNTGISELDHLIGPNRKDTLTRKLERLQKWQFPLLFRSPTRDELQYLGVDVTRVTQKLCFKAAVFLPKDLKRPAFSLINPQAVAGFWIKASDFTPESFRNNSFFSPKKKYWAVLPERNNTWFSYEEVRRQIKPLLEKELSPLLWMKTPKGTFERLFLVWW